MNSRDYAKLAARGGAPAPSQLYYNILPFSINIIIALGLLNSIKSYIYNYYLIPTTYIKTKN